MATFQWQHSDDSFHSGTRYGIVRIVEQQGKFYWRIEQTASSIFMQSEESRSSPPYLESFEQAEEFLLLNLAFLTDPPVIDPDNSQHWLLDYQGGNTGQRLTLDLCEQVLPPGNDPTHLARLWVLRHILFHDDPQTSYVAPILPTRSEPPLDWQQDGDEWSQITWAGLAVITKQQGPPDSYTVRIEHPTGALLPDQNPEHFSGFDEAEEYLKAMLYFLAHPVTDVVDLANLHGYARIQYPCFAFTLDICATGLSDPIHIERVKHIKSDLFLMVD